MGDIYAQATMVFAWLGMASEVPNFDADAVSRALDVETDAIANSTLTLLHVSEHDYWKRLWVVQELRLARRTMVWCRNYSIESGVLLGNIGLLASNLGWVSPRYDQQTKTRLGTFDSEARHTVRSLLDRSAYSQKHEPTLLHVLQMYGQGECSDARDKLIGLQALVVESQRLQIDYSLSLEELVLQAVRIIITKSNYLGGSFKRSTSVGEPHFWYHSNLLNFSPARQIRDIVLDRTKSLHWGFQVLRFINRTCSSVQSEPANDICKKWSKGWGWVHKHAPTARQALLLSDILNQLVELDEMVQPSTSGEWPQIKDALLAGARHIFLNTIVKHGFLMFGEFLSHPDDWPFQPRMLLVFSRWSRWQNAVSRNYPYKIS